MKVYGSWTIHGVIFFYTLTRAVYRIGYLYSLFTHSSAPRSNLLSPCRVPTTVLGPNDSYAYWTIGDIAI